MPAANARLLADIRTLHLRIEDLLQAIGRLLAPTTCATCRTICCREAMCRESVESDFLLYLLGERAADYDPAAGWLDPARGCTLTHGRPLVCYEFFCERFDRDGIAGLRDLARRFKTAYARVQGGRHMLEIDAIGDIPAPRLARVLDRLVPLAADAEATLAALTARPDPAAGAPLHFTARPGKDSP